MDASLGQKAHLSIEVFSQIKEDSSTRAYVRRCYVPGVEVFAFFPLTGQSVFPLQYFLTNLVYSDKAESVKHHFIRSSVKIWWLFRLMCNEQNTNTQITRLLFNLDYIPVI